MRGVSPHRRSIPPGQGPTERAQVRRRGATEPNAAMRRALAEQTVDRIEKAAESGSPVAVPVLWPGYRLSVVCYRVAILAKRWRTPLLVACAVACLLAVPAARQAIAEVANDVVREIRSGWGEKTGSQPRPAANGGPLQPKAQRPVASFSGLVPADPPVSHAQTPGKTFHVADRAVTLPIAVPTLAVLSSLSGRCAWTSRDQEAWRAVEAGQQRVVTLVPAHSGVVDLLVSSTDDRLNSCVLTLLDGLSSPHPTPKSPAGQTGPTGAAPRADSTARAQVAEPARPDPVSGAIEDVRCLAGSQELLRDLLPSCQSPAASDERHRDR